MLGLATVHLSERFIITPAYASLPLRKTPGTWAWAEEETEQDKDWQDERENKKDLMGAVMAQSRRDLR